MDGLEDFENAITVFDGKGFDRIKLERVLQKIRKEIMDDCISTQESLPPIAHHFQFDNSDKAFLKWVEDFSGDWTFASIEELTGYLLGAEREVITGWPFWPIDGADLLSFLEDIR